jgi:hypothetical protein
MNITLISPAEKQRILLTCLDNREFQANMVAALTPEELDRMTMIVLNGQEKSFHLTVGPTHSLVVDTPDQQDPKMVKMAAKISKLSTTLREVFEVVQTKGPITNAELFKTIKSMRSTKTTPSGVYGNLVRLFNLGLIKSSLQPGSKIVKEYSTDYVPTVTTSNDPVVSKNAKTAQEALASLRN